MSEPLISQLRQLVHESIDGIITEHGIAQLNDLLRSDSDTRKYYLDYMNMQIILKNLYANEINIALNNESDVVNYLNNALEQLAADEKIAQPAKSETARLAPPPVRVAIQKIEKSPRQISRAAMITALASMAAMFLLFMFAYLAPLEVASLEDAIDARWSQGDLPLEINSRYRTRQGPMILEKGMVKFRFNNDACVIVEAPAKVEIISIDEIKLYEGRLFARIPPDASGFTVSSPASRVIDIGTNFGVQVDFGGATSVHVMKGLVDLIAGQSAATQERNVVFEKTAMRVSYDGTSIRPIEYNETAFIREISSAHSFIWKGEPLDLVDIAKGGYGYNTDAPFCMINPATGAVERDRFARLEYCLSKGYAPVPTLPGVDGVFIPDQTNDPVQISSMGHLFQECTPTSGLWFMPVLTEAIDSAEFVSEKEGIFSRVTRPSILEKHLYGTPNGRKALILHTNIGITFDLQAIREFVPGTRLTKMAALCGISEAGGRKEADSDLWVLVDGQVRAHYNVQKMNRETVRISIELKLQDRFLTFATTDGGDGIDNDWLVVAEPVLLID